MFTILNKKGQAVSGEYVLVFFIVVGVITTMSVYFKRVVQGRVHDGRNYMIGVVRNQTQGQWNGILYVEYEPYYRESTSTTQRDMRSRTTLVEGGTTGIYSKDVDEYTRVEMKSETKPPREADAEYSIP